MTESDTSKQQLQANEKRNISRHAYDQGNLALIADLVGGELVEASFQLRGERVWKLDVPTDARELRTCLTFWPSIQRVDASSAGTTVVFNRIVHFDLVEGVEVLFRRDGGEYLVIAMGGQIIVKM